MAFLKAPESEETIEICYFPNSGPVEVQEDLTHLAFEVDSLEEFGKHLASIGVSYSDGPTMKEAGGGFAFVDARAVQIPDSGRSRATRERTRERTRRRRLSVRVSVSGT